MVPVAGEWGGRNWDRIFHEFVSAGFYLFGREKKNCVSNLNTVIYCAFSAVESTPSNASAATRTLQSNWTRSERWTPRRRILHVISMSKRQKTKHSFTSFRFDFFYFQFRTTTTANCVKFDWITWSVLCTCVCVCSWAHAMHTVHAAYANQRHFGHKTDIFFEVNRWQVL